MGSVGGELARPVARVPASFGLPRRPRRQCGADLGRAPSRPGVLPARGRLCPCAWQRARDHVRAADERLRDPRLPRPVPDDAAAPPAGPLPRASRSLGRRPHGSGVRRVPGVRARVVLPALPRRGRLRAGGRGRRVPVAAHEGAALSPEGPPARGVRSRPPAVGDRRRSRRAGAAPLAEARGALVGPGARGRRFRRRRGVLHELRADWLQSARLGAPPLRARRLRTRGHESRRYGRGPAAPDAGSRRPVPAGAFPRTSSVRAAAGAAARAGRWRWSST